MEPSLVIKHMFEKYTPYLSLVEAVTKKEWAELLFPTDHENLDFNKFNRFKSADKPTPKIIITALQDIKTLARIEKKLAIPELFQAKSIVDLEIILKRHLANSGERKNYSLSRALIVSKSLVGVEGCIDTSEEDAIRQVSKRIVESHSKILCWKDAPKVGALFIAYALGSDFGAIGFKQAFILCPFSGYDQHHDLVENQELPFDRALEELRAHLALPNTSSERTLQQAIKQDNALVIVVHPNFLTGKVGSSSSNLRKFLKAVEGDGDSDKVQVVLFGQPGFKIDDCRFFNLPLRPGKYQDSLKFLELNWRRYCDYRGFSPHDDQGTRLTRIRNYYGSENALESALTTKPTALRMLAFLASNYNTFSYFDPTVGWEVLAGMPAERLPVEIRLHMDEINGQLRLYAVSCGT